MHLDFHDKKRLHENMNESNPFLIIYTRQNELFNRVMKSIIWWKSKVFVMNMTREHF